MTGTPSLSATDRRLVLRALDSGYALERSLRQNSSSLDQDAHSFRENLLALKDADSPLAKKQSDLVKNVNVALGEKHLMGLLVPLERLLNRSRRDEEFLYDNQDAKQLPAEAIELKSERPRIIVCENLRSAFNVGAIFRTGECFLANEIWLTGYTAPPQKTAMGTDTLVPWKSFAHTREAIKEAKADGFKIVALEVTDDAVPLETFEWPTKSALILGNERFGIDASTLESCDAVVRVSTGGIKNSLNVAIAFGIAAANWRRPPTHKSLKPIGFLRGGHTSPQAAPRQGTYARASQSSGPAEIRLEGRFNDAPANFEQALLNLEGFSHIWLLFDFHQSRSWLPQVRPPRGDGSMKGVFATRSPHRPNSLGLSCVKLESIKDRSLYISQHDLLDGTPIYDIKPYIPEADSVPDAQTGWLDSLPPAHPILEAEIATQKLNWLSDQGESRLRSFIWEQLRYQPLDSSRKRIEIKASSPSGTAFIVSFRTWRIHTKLEASPNPSLPANILIEDIGSGYTEHELAKPKASNVKESHDKYGDLQLHRDFRNRFG